MTEIKLDRGMRYNKTVRHFQFTIRPACHRFRLRRMAGRRFVRYRCGQSLIELLIGMAIGSLMIIAAASVIAPTLRINTQTSRAQTAAALGKALMDNASVWAEGDWHRIAGLATSSAFHFYLNASSSPFSSSTGDESVVVSTTTYKRFFYVDDVYRDGSGNITPTPGNHDPSTKKITVGYSWPNAATNTVSSYITRSNNRVYVQSDWSGGPNQAGPITNTNSLFASSSNIIYSSGSSIFINL